MYSTGEGERAIGRCTAASRRQGACPSKASSTGVSRRVTCSSDHARALSGSCRLSRARECGRVECGCWPTAALQLYRKSATSWARVGPRPEHSQRSLALRAPRSRGGLPRGTARLLGRAARVVAADAGEACAFRVNAHSSHRVRTPLTSRRAVLYVVLTGIFSSNFLVQLPRY